MSVKRGSLASCRTDNHRRADAIRNKGVGKLLRDQMSRPPARAVLRHNDTRIELFQRLNRRHNDWLEDRTREMKAADNAVYLIHPGEFSCMLKRIDHARVAATG